jgi:hypothetical protein
MLWLLLAVRTERVTAYVLGMTVEAARTTPAVREDARHAAEVAPRSRARKDQAVMS